jgi:hypothetical protein
VKLRIRGNSIRLRLGRSEVRRLADEGRVRESTSFGPTQSLFYTIEAAVDAAEISASFEGGTLRIRVPRDAVRRWVTGGEVGISATQPIGDGMGASLSILIEKDLECIDGPESEPQDDAFPNPQRCR